MCTSKIHEIEKRTPLQLCTGKIKFAVRDSKINKDQEMYKFVCTSILQCMQELLLTTLAELIRNAST